MGWYMSGTETGIGMGACLETGDRNRGRSRVRDRCKVIGAGAWAGQVWAGQVQGHGLGRDHHCPLFCFFYALSPPPSWF